MHELLMIIWLVGESRLFGFVTMETAEEADAAITALNATELMGKIMTVVRVSSALFVVEEKCQCYSS